MTFDGHCMTLLVPTFSPPRHLAAKDGEGRSPWPRKCLHSPIVARLSDEANHPSGARPSKCIMSLLQIILISTRATQSGAQGASARACNLNP
jgi:hypothetical protein